MSKPFTFEEAEEKANGYANGSLRMPREDERRKVVDRWLRVAATAKALLDEQIRNQRLIEALTVAREACRLNLGMALVKHEDALLNAFNHANAVLSSTPEALNDWLKERDAKVRAAALEDFATQLLTTSALPHLHKGYQDAARWARKIARALLPVLPEKKKP